MSRNPDASAEDDYSLQVESHFATRRGTPFIFSAKDWALLQQWKESGIPLPIVLEAIDRCFEKRRKAGRYRTISSLRYCRHAVKELWEERKELLVGAGADIPELDPQKRLEELAAALHLSAGAATAESVGGCLHAAAEQLRRIGAGKSVPQIEEELLAIEQQLIEQLTAALPSEEREALERELDGELIGYAASNAEVLEKTRQANLRRLLRRRLSLPRLSLFG